MLRELVELGVGQRRDHRVVRAVLDVVVEALQVGLRGLWLGALLLEARHELALVERGDGAAARRDHFRTVKRDLRGTVFVIQGQKMSRTFLT